MKKFILYVEDLDQLIIAARAAKWMARNEGAQTCGLLYGDPPEFDAACRKNPASITVWVRKVDKT